MQKQGVTEVNVICYNTMWKNMVLLW